MNYGRQSMSNWTHVNGSIRIESLPQNNDLILEDIEKCFGKIIEYEDLVHYGWYSKVPCGTEGSLKYDFIPNEEENSMNAGVLVIYGDLRDYTSQFNVVDWIKQAVSMSEVWWVRSCAIKIDTDNKKSLILYDNPDIEKVDRLEVLQMASRKQKI